MIRLFSILIYAIAFSACANIKPIKIRMVTEEIPPLQINNHNKPATGAMVELVKLMLKEAHLQGNIEFYPWSRAFKIAQSEPNTLIFSMLRDKTRERFFQWIGQIYTLKSCFVALKSRHDIFINSTEAAKKYTVGTIRDDLAQSYLTQHGFREKQNMFLNTAYPALWKMLFIGRSDLAFTNNIVWRFEVARAGLDPNKIQVLYNIPDISTELYLAASLNTSKHIVQQLQQALEKIKADGRYQAIMTKWHI